MINKVPSQDFNADAYQDWKKRVEKELKGESFEDHLVWKSQEGFEQPSYEHDLPSPLPQLVPRKEAWKIIEPIFEGDALTANKHALSALNAGAEGIWFNKAFLGAAAQVASKEIINEVAPVFIKGGNVIDVFKPLFNNKDIVKAGASNDCYYLLDGGCYRDRGATLTAEIAYLLSSAISLLDQGVQPEKILFKSAYGSAFLSEIAKTRALRWLWASLLAHRSLSISNPFILATNLNHHYPKADEHNNILRATSSAISAIIGGADLLMITPWNHHWHQRDEFSTRISRNIQLLLKEESRLDKNLNPADGAYFIESMTQKMAKVIWDKTRTILKAGGFNQFVLSRQLLDELTKMRTNLIFTYKENENTLLGINKYPPAIVPEEQAPPFTKYELLPDYCHIPTAIKM